MSQLKKTPKMSIKKIKETSLISENILSQKMMHSVTFPTNKEKQRKKYQTLSSNHNLKLKFSGEIFLNIFVKNFLRLSSFFIFFAIPCSDFMGTSRGNSSLVNSYSTRCNIQPNIDVSNSTVIDNDCGNSNNDASDVLGTDQSQEDQRNEFYQKKLSIHKKKCKSIYKCINCDIEIKLPELHQKSIYIRDFGYPLSFFLFGIVVVMVINWYNSNNSSVIEIEDYKKKSSTNRRKRKEKSMNRRRKK